MKRAYFIIGTDTDCGKTLVTGALAATARSLGIDVGVMKPMESGGTDSQFLQSCAGVDDPLELIRPYYFTEPLAPGIAARRASVDVSMDHIVVCFEQLRERHDLLFVEGAGGLIVPLIGEQTHIELLQRLQIPVLLVARLGLGTLNHTLLTLQALEHNDIACSGIILNEVTPAGSLAEETNPEELQRLTSVPLLGVMPYVKDPDRPEYLAQTVPRSVKEFLANE